LRKLTCGPEKKLGVSWTSLFGTLGRSEENNNTGRRKEEKAGGLQFQKKECHLKLWTANRGGKGRV